jgi:hypothetical protein
LSPVPHHKSLLFYDEELETTIAAIEDAVANLVLV